MNEYTFHLLQTGVMVFMKDADTCERTWNTDVQTTALNPHIMIRLVI